jgi:hypothetical protein
MPKAAVPVYCRLLSVAHKRVDKDIDGVNALIKSIPLNEGEVIGRLIDGLYDSREKLSEFRDRVEVLEQLFCGLD